jgi:hypothetical protein
MTRRKVETLLQCRYERNLRRDETLLKRRDERSLGEMKPCWKPKVMSVGGKELLNGGGETAEGLGMGAREKKPY